MSHGARTRWDRARGYPAGGAPVIRQTRTSEPPAA